FQYNMFYGYIAQKFIYSPVFKSYHSPNAQFHIIGNCFLSLNMISRKTMEDPKKIIIFFRFQHFKYFVKCIPAMNYHRKFFSFCQLYLETEGFLLLFQKRFIPKKINSCFSHCKEFPGCK